MDPLGTKIHKYMSSTKVHKKCSLFWFYKVADACKVNESEGAQKRELDTVNNAKL